MKVVEDAQLAVKRKLPWFIDALFYPVSISGIIHIVIFLVVPFVISLINRYILGWVWPVGELMALLLYLLYIGYVFSYLGFCIFDSSKGGLRAPDISMELTPDKGELVWQLFLILGSIAVCFWPTAVSYILTERTDRTFWLLLSGGIFFFPIALLRGIMFDSYDALNPISIIGSALSAFLPYCGLVLLICGFGGFVAIILPRLPVWGFVSRGVSIYLLFVVAHLLGRFYWWHKEKLDWGL